MVALLAVAVSLAAGAASFGSREIRPLERRHEILHNQRGRLLETVLEARTDVIIATPPFHIHD